ncbi:LptF/LptG family permease [Treponema sp. TIM-1]|uniref:LptF/LptG family permease n=1 Tax=Treponema sp. TIM-1 TaxID=2898417 RepID=UPI00397FD8A4
MENKRSASWTMFRSIFFETLISFLVAFLFFFFVFFVNQLLLMAQEILTKKVPFQQVALLVLFSLPSVVAMSAPFASLVGTLMTIGRMTSDNEVLVMLSSGLSYRNIFIPAITIGVVISILSFLANDILLPAGTVQFTRLYRRILVSTPALELESNSVKRFKDTVLVTGNVENTSIDDILILDKTSDGERRLIMARNAELRDGGREGMSLDLTNAFVQTSKEVARQDYDYASSSFLRYLIPQDDLMQAVSSIGPREMSSTDVKREIKTQEDELGVRLDEEYNRALSYALSLETALRYGPQREEWNQRANTMSSFVKGIATAAVIKNNRNLLIYRLEYYKKFSIPFGALSFVFLAVSLGLLAKKSGQTVGFIFGLIIAVIYWALLLGGQTMGIRLGYSPFWSMWFPNILAISIGLLMGIIRIRR